MAAAALAGVQQWDYRPLKINGIPVEVAIDIDLYVKAACLTQKADL